MIGLYYIEMLECFAVIYRDFFIVQKSEKTTDHAQRHYKKACPATGDTLRG